MCAKFDYAKAQTTASRLMARFAQGVVTLTRPAASTPGANAWDAPTTGDPEIWTLDATVKGVSEEFVDGETVKITDLEVAAAVFASEPKPGDILTIDGQVRTVITTRRIPSAGVVVAWKFIIKG